MFLAHAPIAFLGNQLMQKKKIVQLKQSEAVIVGIFALLFGILPDIDILALIGFSVPQFMHHAYMSHTPIFYIGIWIFLRLFYWVSKRWFNKTTLKFLNPEFVNVILNTFLIATLLHILADIFAEDIMLLYPFTTQYFTIFKYALQPNLFGGYFLGVTFGLEVVLCSVFFIYLLNVVFKKSLLHKIVNILLVVPSILFLILTIYAHFNTYNRNILYDSNGKVNYDLDYDTLRDDLDMDVDNDGKDNIMDIDLKKLVAQVKEIVESKKWTADIEDSSLQGQIRYKVGGFTSFRLLSQAYSNIHSPISPVLKDMLTKDGSIEKYSRIYDSQGAFYKYFNNKKILLELDPNVEGTIAQGALFFVSNDKEEVLNMGIVLEENNLGTVLPYDKNLKTHTLKELTNYYGTEVKIWTTR